MAANNQLSTLEQRVWHQIKCSVKPPTADDLRFYFRHSHVAYEVLDALLMLISVNLIEGSATAPITYSIVTLKGDK